MKSMIWIVMKKEFNRFFGDKRLVFSTLILPALMIYVMYSFMGNGFSEQFSVDEDYQSKIYVTNMPQSLKPVIDKMKVKVLDSKQDEEMKQAIKNKDADLYMIFPADFDKEIEAYDAQTATEAAPNIQIYYNSVRTESSSIYATMEEVLSHYESSMCNKFNVNDGKTKYDLATDKDTTGRMFSMMLPMLLLTFVFSGCMSIAPESIAGEKERGTIAKLLVSPAKRNEIALGKIMSLSVLGLLCGTSSFVGTILSMPKLMQMDDMSASASVYSVGDYAMLLVVILSTVLIIVGLLSVISAFAKTVKEATTYVTPVLIIVMLTGLSSMFTEGAAKELYMYCIPMYNSVQCMNGIFSFSADISQIVVTVVVNTLVTGVLSVILTKMFNSEKVMFS